MDKEITTDFIVFEVRQYCTEDFSYDNKTALIHYRDIGRENFYEHAQYEDMLTELMRDIIDEDHEVKIVPKEDNGK